MGRYWESIEMLRKFLMTSLLVNMIAVGTPEQVAVGAPANNTLPRSNFRLLLSFIFESDI